MLISNGQEFADALKEARSKRARVQQELDEAVKYFGGGLGAGGRELRAPSMKLQEAEAEVKRLEDALRCANCGAIRNGRCAYSGDVIDWVYCGECWQESYLCTWKRE
jgi:hypothetical protein